MGQQIIRQPNGLFAIWSSVVDDFTLVDATRDELIETMVEDQRIGITANVDRFIEGKSIKTQFTKTFEQCVEIIRDIHGDDAESLQMLGLAWQPLPAPLEE